MDEAIRARLGLPLPDRGKPRRDLRVFGFGLGILLSILALLNLRKGGSAWPHELVVAAVSAALAALAPEALKPVYKPWMKAAGLIGRANTFLINALVYYLIMTPYAAVIRLRGHDLLDEKLRDRDSYWHEKPPPEGRESYLHQY